jgi:regulator of protease activity HflC (stomatin/prohibitin superfamily)
MKDVSTRPIHLSWAASVIGLIILILGAVLAAAANATALVPAYLAGAVVLALGLLAVGRTHFQRRQAVEEDDVAEYRRTHGATELFEDADEAVRLAARANEHYVKYFVPVVTILVGLALLGTMIVLWQRWAETDTFIAAKTPLSMAVLSLVVFLASLICGSYFVGVSREEGCRWVRPAGAWMFFSGLLFLLGSVALFCEHFGIAVEQIDPRIARVSAVLTAVLGAELVLSFVIEFYRPRMPGEKERPLPESRLLALFTEPGGVARNVAASLDYQFGFKVSEVWFYRFLERTVVPFGVLLLITLWLLTCIVVVKTEENGIRERFGAVVSETPLEPGIYFKLPAPFAKIYKFPVDRVQEIPIGYVPAGAGEEAQMDPLEEELQGDPEGRVIVWSKRHYKHETDFIVASTPEANERQQLVDDGGGAPVTVSFMSASLPLYYKIKNLYDYRYRHADPEVTLEDVATREVVRYLASVDFFTILTSGRAEGADVLAGRIQDAADDIQLGIQVVFIGLQGIHPPVYVGAAFDDVVAASEERHQRILEAETYAIRREPQAEGDAAELVSKAEAYREERVRVSAAEADRFQKQLLGFAASPRLFVLNSYLNVLENEAAPIRKYIVATPSGSEVFILNLEKKLRPDLLDITDTQTEADE